jgi:hypothetical protein
MLLCKLGTAFFFMPKWAYIHRFYCWLGKRFYRVDIWECNFDWQLPKAVQCVPPVPPECNVKVRKTETHTTYICTCKNNLKRGQVSLDYGKRKLWIKGGSIRNLNSQTKVRLAAVRRAKSYQMNNRSICRSDWPQPTPPIDAIKNYYEQVFSVKSIRRNS